MTPRFLQVPAQLPSGLPPIRIAFVGEAPSNEEQQEGVPLVGPAGRIFNSLLRTAGIDRSECLVTNVFNEKLPDNDVRNWCITYRDAVALGGPVLPPIGDAGVLAPPYRHHLVRLGEEISAWRPNVVVPLGGTALWAFTGSSRISAVRGTVLSSSQTVVGVKLLPTFHPQAVQYQWKFYPVVVGDLMKATFEADRGPSIILPNRELILEPTLHDLRALEPRLLGSDLLSVDIETGWGQITCIGFAWDAEHALCVPFLDKRKPDRNYWRTADDEAAAWQWVREIMGSPVPKLGQNFGAYDAYWLLARKRVSPVNMVHDTRLQHHALYPELPKDLEFMGASYATQGAWKHWGKKAQEKRDA